MLLNRFRIYVIDHFSHVFRWYFRFLCIEYIFVRSSHNILPRFVCFFAFSVSFLCKAAQLI